MTIWQSEPLQLNDGIVAGVKVDEHDGALEFTSGETLLIDAHMNPEQMRSLASRLALGADKRDEMGGAA